MHLNEVTYYFNKFKFGEDNFHNLMSYHVQEILIVSSFYDAFIFEQDGKLSEKIFGEYRQLNLSKAPRITSVPTGEEALNIMKKVDFDMVITRTRIGEITAHELSKEIHNKYPEIPVLLLLNDNELQYTDKSDPDMQYFENLFFWTGDSNIFLTMIKYVEDRKNLEYDTSLGLVQVILLVEDSIAFYSRYFPLLYSIVVRQTQHLIKQELNDNDKMLRMRARPKVIMCHTYDDAMNLYEQYKDNIIAIISDVSYPCNGKMEDFAGINLLTKLKKENPYVSFLLQSHDIENKEYADKIGVSFLHKNSPTLLSDLRHFVVKRLGYGDFIFRDSKGKKLMRASTLSDFKQKLLQAPDDSILYHSKMNDFSTWLQAHGAFLIAKELRCLKIKDFRSVNEIRSYLNDIFQEVQNLKNRGKIISYNKEIIDQDDCVVRLADGSLGGKGRGLAFLNALLVSMEYENKYQGVRIKIPRTFIIGTDEFDKFVETNNISSKIAELSDDEIETKFLKSHLSPELKDTLYEMMEYYRTPFAVRSSGLLEDSQAQPFAGIYRTYLIPNNHQHLYERFKHITDAIKLVYASVFLSETRKYIESINYKLEDEKMAVVIQQVAGEKHDSYFYPHISGVAQSYNYYPVKGFTATDGIASVAIGLGKTVVDGERTFKFVPGQPKRDILSTDEMMRSTQKKAYVLDMKNSNGKLSNGEKETYAHLRIRELQSHNTLSKLVSVWDYTNERLVDDIKAKGPVVVTFSSILKYDVFPLAKIIKDMLDIGQIAMGAPVEIEFAVNLQKYGSQKRPIFYLLQIRPLTVNEQEYSIPDDLRNPENTVFYSTKSMGNGIHKNVQDFIIVDPDLYDPNKTMEISEEIEILNTEMIEEGKKYVLIGPGRWGTRDRFLGVPVRWDQISNSEVIIEVTKEEYAIDSSQGTHFFHNLISQQVGYVSIPHNSESDYMNWERVTSGTLIRELKYCKHYRLVEQVDIIIDGKNGESLAFFKNC